MPTFDKDSFLDTQVEGTISDKYTPVPEFDEARGFIPEGGINARAFTNKETGQTSIVMEISWVVDEEEARTATKMERPTVRQQMFLDLNPGGGIDNSDGKNVKLGKLLKALGLNTGTFSPRQLEGCQGKLRIRHYEHEGDTFAEVKGVAPL